MFDPTQTIRSPTRFTVVLMAFIVAGGPVLGTAMAQSDPTGLTADGPAAWEQTHKFLTPGGGNFGTDVALDGHTAVIGAPNAADGGHVQILSDESGDWDVEAEFVSPADSGQHAFGTSVDVDGDLAIVGDTGDAHVFDHMTEGNAYILEKTGSTWFIAETLSPPADTETNRGFGYSVAIDEATQTAIVGSPVEDTSTGGEAGTVTVFHKEGGAWTLEATLTPDNPRAGALFGHAVALDQTTALVGAPFDDSVGTSAGAAFVFEGGSTGWTQTAKLLGSQPNNDTAFGDQVALEGSKALVGSSDPAYVFSGLPAAVTEEARLLPDDRARVLGLFDSSLRLFRGGDLGFDGDTAVIGGPATSPLAPGGKAFVFEDGGSGDWSQVTELEKRDAESRVPDSSEFGAAVAVDDDRAIIGAPREDSREASRNGGAAYLFTPCTEDGPVSQPVHESVEPASGPAQETVHDVNCHWVKQLE